LELLPSLQQHIQQHLVKSSQCSTTSLQTQTLVVFLVKRRGGKSWEVAGGCRKCGLGPLEPKFSKNARTKKNRSKAHISDAPLLYNKQ
jgi:hypothetical protein